MCLCANMCVCVCVIYEFTSIYTHHVGVLSHTAHTPTIHTHNHTQHIHTQYTHTHTHTPHTHTHTEGKDSHHVDKACYGCGCNCNCCSNTSGRHIQPSMCVGAVCVCMVCVCVGCVYVHHALCCSCMGNVQTWLDAHCAIFMHFLCNHHTHYHTHYHTPSHPPPSTPHPPGCRQDHPRECCCHHTTNQ